jgi:hypothetical protein
VKTWASPFGMVIQPDALLVPRRPAFVPEQDDAYGWPHGSHLVIEEIERRDDTVWWASERVSYPGKPRGGAGNVRMTLVAASIPRWNLAHLTSDELMSLIVACDEQLSVGAGNPCPAWKGGR